MHRLMCLVLVAWLAMVALMSGMAHPALAQPDSPYFRVVDRLSFTFDPQVAQDVTGQRVPASHDVQTPTGPIPEYLDIQFQNFVENTGWVATGQFIHLYPVVTFPADPNAPFSQALEQLRAVLAARPNVPDSVLPMLPVVTASQILRSQVQYLDFANGSGIRYVTAAGLDVSPLSEQVLFYTFQGLTSDGAYYIAAQFPIVSGVLPPVAEAMNEKQYSEFVAGYGTYLAQITALLDGVAPESFAPALPVLDRMLASITVTAPAATVLTPQGDAAGAVTFDNTQFSYDGTLASRIEVDIKAPFDDPNGMSMFGSLPGETVFTFFDYPVVRPYGTANMRVMAVDSFPQTGTISDQMLAQLQAFLATRAPLQAQVMGGESWAGIPALPVVNAAQVFVAKPEYIDFQNGSGVRFITYYSQAPNPLVNANIFYAFQGMTADGRYVVTAEFPLRAPVLPDSIDFNTFDYDAFSMNYGPYIAETVAALDGVAAGDYGPSLDLLDALVRSVRVGS